MTLLRPIMFEEFPAICVPIFNGFYGRALLIWRSADALPKADINLASLHCYGTGNKYVELDKD